jgi:DNA polymerase III epsilon subunit-like protein
MFPGICLDLETTIAGKCGHRIPGTKRYETRITEIGCVNWENTEETFGHLVNPVPATVKLENGKSLMKWLKDNYQKPAPTINFWAKVLTNRGSLSKEMFINPEPPEIWNRMTAINKANDFARWHNTHGIGPQMLTEKEALQKLIEFTAGLPWIAHNGNSFDYKVLQGASLRTGVAIPNTIVKHDSLRIFRKMIPGYKSYSQPKLYSAIFKRDYNAHVAIDDARALAELCRHVSNKQSTNKVPQSTPMKVLQGTPATPKRVVHKKKPMELTFGRSSVSTQAQPKQYVWRSRGPRPEKNYTAQKITKLIQIRGIGQKSIAAMAAVNVLTILQLKERVKADRNWLKNTLPFGVKHNKVYKELQKL